MAGGETRVAFIRAAVAASYILSKSSYPTPESFEDEGENDYKNELPPLVQEYPVSITRLLKPPLLML